MGRERLADIDIDEAIVQLELRIKGRLAVVLNMLELHETWMRRYQEYAVEKAALERVLNDGIQLGLFK